MYISRGASEQLLQQHLHMKRPGVIRDNLALITYQATNPHTDNISRNRAQNIFRPLYNYNREDYSW
jgi:hypothetical protein